jgi:NAD+ synthase (glutamine-hydrolysing)
MERKFTSFGFIRVGVASPELQVADIDFNLQAIKTTLAELASQDCQLAVFPELCLTGYSCGDLFYQSLLLDHSVKAVGSIAKATEKHQIAAVIGLPLEVLGRLYNCAVFISGGSILGIVPKTYLPTTNEFYEQRWFTSGASSDIDAVVINGAQVPFGTDLLFNADNIPGLTLGLEICEDLWAVKPLSEDMALAGATLLANPSASNELLSKAEYRRELVKQQSARCLAAYLYASAGPNESTTDLVYSGHSLIAENGQVLSETDRFQFTTQAITADIDVQKLVHERVKNSSFSAAKSARTYRLIKFSLPVSKKTVQTSLLRALSQTPFVPGDPTQRAKHCQEILNIQSTGLAKRLKYTAVEKVTLGISGGLDSTLALLVTIRAFEILGLERKGIVAVTMPGPGTTSRTLNNAEKLIALLGVTHEHIPIQGAVDEHLTYIGHEEGIFDITYENAQARERTQILMDLGNQIGGFTVGTGDLTELALGWCTYNADQMSMYHVNAGVPKTLVRYLIEWQAECVYEEDTSRILFDICETPISPELLPLEEGRDLVQKTEESIGPFILHDFFLFYTVRYAFSPRKVFFLAHQAFQDRYQPEIILKWLKVFYRRFITQQFKRSAMPDGPKVGSVALSPRGDWRMPSDASYHEWLNEIELMGKEGVPLV